MWWVLSIGFLFMANLYMVCPLPRCLETQLLSVCSVTLYLPCKQNVLDVCLFQISCCWQSSSAGGVMPWQPFRRKNKYRHVGERGAEEETSFDTELLPRSVSDGNLVRCGAKYYSSREALSFLTSDGFYFGSPDWLSSWVDSHTW